MPMIPFSCQDEELLGVFAKCPWVLEESQLVLEENNVQPNYKSYILIKMMDKEVCTK